MKTEYLSSEELNKMNFGKIGNNVLIDQYVNITQPENIFIENNVRIDSFTNLISSGKLQISNNVHISSFCHIVSYGGIFMDDFSGLSQGVKVYSITDDYIGNEPTNPTIPVKFKTIYHKKIIIGKYVIVGSNSIIMPGATLQEGSSVGALSFVNKKLDPWYVYEGKPIRKICKRKKTMIKKYKEYLKDN
ncbi:MAG: dTDP-4-amino-4,6-dideoxy-D-glucose acyltransferase [Alphaproteobacteria bacterium MarineAlpha5_Bin8]|nr:MAG: dTDP-4-amino-4,6-dideoxy-D-glucose acyltransferase [Alphaproteobacteria bacterium MarineAlpha5_Bin8]PPR54538.1 MAG: dTDP-4-amino-4,6-dideoxy-D-glucose acyltransferase [Alphaproteobacteria bacterium MarineAlpha5_Bin6]|tara:strand:- start:4484 stop:5050 length:567 start_codon:yes stop_codon:yes gene_type:complete